MLGTDTCELVGTDTCELVFLSLCFLTELRLSNVSHRNCSATAKMMDKTPTSIVDGACHAATIAALNPIPKNCAYYT